MVVTYKKPDFKNLLGRINITTTVKLNELAQMGNDPTRPFTGQEIEALSSKIRELQFLNDALGTAQQLQDGLHPSTSQEEPTKTSKLQ